MVPVLSYGENQSGWNDDLTLLHEGNAGSMHFIDLASRAHTLSEMRHWLPAVEQPVVMDIGCSSGFMIREYRDHLPGSVVIGADIVRGPLERLAARMPDVPLLHFDLVKCPLPDACLDGISLLNVLEHIKDDQTALKQVYRILKPGGELIGSFNLNHAPTKAEPQALTESLLQQLLFADFTIISWRVSAPDTSEGGYLYNPLLTGKLIDPQGKPVILWARTRKTLKTDKL